MDTTDPDICFDEQGVCSHCSYFDRHVRPLLDSSEDRRGQLATLIARMREAGRGKRYDCIIGLSGGTDSSYLAVKIAEWGLRPLVVHVDAGWNSELAVGNIEQICRRLKFDLVTHVVDWEIMKDVQLAFLRSGVANQDVPQDHAFFAALYRYAVKSQIRYVCSGSNLATESILPSAWGHNAMDARHLTAIHSRFGSRKLRHFPIASFFDIYVRYPFLSRMTVVKPLNYLDYYKEVAVAELERDYGWRYYGGKHYESRWTRFFQGYYLPHRFGYDKRKAHLSSLVLAGQLSRSAALVSLQAPLYEEVLLREDKLFVAKKLGIELRELESFIEQPIRHFSEFPNQQRLLRTARRLNKVLKLVLQRSARS